MNNVKKTLKKGFTLVELIVVMAIFSILLVGVMSLTGPISRIFQDTSTSEKTYSYANNIQVYLQGKLEYADYIGVYTSDKLASDPAVGVTHNDLAVLAEDFRQSHYEYILTGDGPGSDHPTKGKIYIMRLVNPKDANGDGILDGSADIYPGQITLRTYDFLSDVAIPSDANPTEEIQLNEAFFNAKDSAYTFSYALGSNVLTTVATPSGLSGTYRALEKDFNGADHGATQADFSISIVIDKTKISVDTKGDSDPDNDEYVYNGFVESGNYRAFKSPVAIQIANLPFTNINYRAKINSTPYGVKRVRKDPVTGDKDYQGNMEAGLNYETATEDTIDFNNDIYFIFAYADELT